MLNPIPAVKRRWEVIRHSRLRDYFSESPVYIFHHIPKCAGTSVRHVLAKWFLIINDYLPDPTTNPEGAARFCKNHIDLNKLRTRHVLCGHYETHGVHLRERYPEMWQDQKRYRLFTFLRDPLEHRISHYYYIRKIHDYPMPPLECWLTEFGTNLIAKIFPCTESDYRRVLDRYFFVGITERLQDSLIGLAERLHKKRVTVPMLNAIERERSAMQLSPALRSRFRTDNELDFKIYAYALERFERSCR